MTNLKYPVQIDSWCEDSLWHYEGYWQSWIGNLTLDTSVFAIGGASIKTWTDQYWYNIAAAFYFNYLFDASRTNTTLHFLIALEKDKMAGSCTVSLIDVNGKYANKDFTANTLGVWEPKDLPMSVFSVDSGFDWTQIATILISANQVGGGYPPQGGAFWIEQTYFSYDVPDSILLITSSPSGKNGVYTDDLYGALTFITPSEFTRPVGQAGYVQMDNVNFDHWDNNPSDNNPSIPFTFPSTNTTLLAVYTVAANPLLVIDSFDQDMKTYVATAGVKLVHGGTPSVLTVPFQARVGKGLYSFTTIETAKRTFVHWILPDNTTPTDKTITWDVQNDTRLETHWQVTANGDGGFNYIPIIIGGVFVITLASLYFFKKK